MAQNLSVKPDRFWSGCSSRPGEGKFCKHIIKTADPIINNQWVKAIPSPNEKVDGLIQEMAK